LPKWKWMQRWGVDRNDDAENVFTWLTALEKPGGASDY
jgi:hypothetical protein